MRLSHVVLNMAAPDVKKFPQFVLKMSFTSKDYTLLFADGMIHIGHLSGSELVSVPLNNVAYMLPLVEEPAPVPADYELRPDPVSDRDLLVPKKRGRKQG